MSPRPTANVGQVARTAGRLADTPRRHRFQQPVAGVRETPMPRRILKPFADKQAARVSERANNEQDSLPFDCDHKPHIPVTGTGQYELTGQGPRHHLLDRR